MAIGLQTQINEPVPLWLALLFALSLMLAALLGDYLKGRAMIELKSSRTEAIEDARYLRRRVDELVDKVADLRAERDKLTGDLDWMQNHIGELNAQIVGLKEQADASAKSPDR